MKQIINLIQMENLIIIDHLLSFGAL